MNPNGLPSGGAPVRSHTGVSGSKIDARVRLSWNPNERGRKMTVVGQVVAYILDFMRRDGSYEQHA